VIDWIIAHVTECVRLVLHYKPELSLAQDLSKPGTSW